MAEQQKTPSTQQEDLLQSTASQDLLDKPASPQSAANTDEGDLGAVAKTSPTRIAANEYDSQVEKMIYSLTGSRPRLFQVRINLICHDEQLKRAILEQVSETPVQFECQVSKNRLCLADVVSCNGGDPATELAAVKYVMQTIVEAEGRPNGFNRFNLHATSLIECLEVVDLLREHELLSPATHEDCRRMVKNLLERESDDGMALNVLLDAPLCPKTPQFVAQLRDRLREQIYDGVVDCNLPVDKICKNFYIFLGECVAKMYTNQEETDEDEFA